MSEITIHQIDPNDQDEFFNQKYQMFLFNAVYGYLFEGLDLRSLEVKYLNDEKHNGHFSRSVLNLMGIDTAVKSHNIGLYSGRDVVEVVKELVSSPDHRLNNIGWALGQYVRYRSQ